MNQHIRTPDESLYDQLNQQFFRGRLPRFRVTRASKYFARGGMRFGFCSTKRRLILLDPNLSADRLRQTLLHEMCHVRGDENHGPPFRRQLRSLHRQGEEWAAIEIDYYRCWEQFDGFYKDQLTTNRGYARIASGFR
jgi:hypothetical protein